jgi:membrane-associated phospholipid phosphatase
MGAALVALTLAICATRVLAGMHFVRDVAAGAALGFALGALGMFL